MSFAARLLEWLLAPLLFLWLFSLGFIFFAARESVDTALDDQLNLAASTIHGEWIDANRSNAAHAVDGFPSITLRRLLTNESRYPIRYLIADANGKLLAGDDEMLSLASSNDGEFASFDATKAPAEGFNTVLEDEFVRVVRYRVSTVDRTTQTLVVAQARERQQRLLKTVLFYEIVPQTAVLLIAIFLAWYGLTYVVHPMRDLKSAIDARGGGDLTALPAQAAPAEIVPLITSINDLMARLSVSLNAQKRFIANAAHQLRTPIAALRAHSELLKKTVDPARRAHTIEQLLTTSERATRLAQQLLSLARAESFGTTAQFAKLDLGELCRSVAHEMLPLALEREIELAFDEADASVLIEGDSTLLTELVHNLVDNALKYAPRGGEVQISIRTNPPRIKVEDSGAGIAEHERDRVFAPFARIVRYEAGSEHAIGGTGLGLAIVEQVAKAHRARIEVARSERFGGAAFVVTFEQPQAS